MAHDILKRNTILKLIPLQILSFIFAKSFTLSAAVITVTTNADGGAGSLRDSMLNADSGDTIQFDSTLNGSTITLASPLPIIRDYSIVGPANKITIDGQNQNPGLFVYQGSSQLSNLNIVNTLSQGGDGGAGRGGGGGALGVGAGLFVNTATSVTASNLSFTNNQSVGGNGGAADASLVGGGGGGGAFKSEGGACQSSNVLAGGGGGGGVWNSKGGDVPNGDFFGGGGGGGIHASPGGNAGNSGGGGGGGAYSSNGGAGSSASPRGFSGGGGGGYNGENGTTPQFANVGGNGGGPNAGSAGGGKAGTQGGGGGGTSSTIAIDAEGGSGGSEFGGGGGAASVRTFGGTSIQGGDATIGGGGGGSRSIEGNSAAMAGGSSTFGGGGGGGGAGSSIASGNAGTGGLLGGGGGGTGTNVSAGAGGVDGVASPLGGGGGGSGSAPSGRNGQGGFGAGNGGSGGEDGGAGSALGSAIFVREGGSLTLLDTNFSGNTVTAGGFGTGTPVADGRDLYLMNNSVTVITLNTPDTTVPVFIAGGINEPAAGTLNKQGSGTLLLDTQSLNSYNGIVNVNQGVVNVAGQLNGTFNISTEGMLKGIGFANIINNSGKVAPGNSIGTLNVGSYTQTSDGVLEVEIDNAGASDLLNVATTASLSGTVNVVTLDDKYIEGTTYTIVTAAGGVNGTFSNLTTNSIYTFLLRYFPNEVQLQVSDIIINPFEPFEGNVGRLITYIESNVDSLDPDLIKVLNAVNRTNRSAFKKDMEQLQPSWFASLGWSNATLLSTISALFPKQIAYNPCACDCFTPSSNFWITGLHEHIQQKNLSQLPGFHANDNGIIGGIDRQFTENLLLGIGGGHTHTNFKWNSLKGGATINSGHAGPYAVFAAGNWIFDAQVLGSWDSVKTKRHLEFGAIERKAKARFQGASALAHLGVAYTYETCYATFIPYFGADYIYLHQNRFRENGANSVNLRMKKYNQQFLKTELGSALTRSWNVCGGTLTPALTLGLNTLSKLSGNHLKASLSSLPGAFSALTSNRTILQVATGIDVGYTINNQVTIFASFSGEYARKQQNQRFSGGINWSF